MGRKIQTEEDAKQAMHWLKEITRVEDFEDALVLGFHRVTVQEQTPIEELRDMYLLVLDGRVKMNLNSLYATA